jgi:hypothetical protein
MGVTRFSGGRPGAAVVHLPKRVEVSSSPFRNKLISIHLRVFGQMEHWRAVEARGFLAEILSKD